MLSFNAQQKPNFGKALAWENCNPRLGSLHRHKDIGDFMMISTETHILNPHIQSVKK